MEISPFDNILIGCYWVIGTVTGGCPIEATTPQGRVVQAIVMIVGRSVGVVHTINLPSDILWQCILIYGGGSSCIPNTRSVYTSSISLSTNVTMTLCLPSPPSLSTNVTMTLCPPSHPPSLPTHRRRCVVLGLSHRRHRQRTGPSLSQSLLHVGAKRRRATETTARYGRKNRRCNPRLM